MENDYSLSNENQSYLCVLLAGLLFLSCPIFTFASKDSLTKSGEGASISGQVSATIEFYNTQYPTPRYEPFSWTLYGNLSLKSEGWKIPLSFILSEKDRSFRQAFNQIGISPEWRWLKLHAGYRNIFFSNFSLAGVTMLGAGVEMYPGLFRFGAVYGRLQRAVASDTANMYGVQPAFERWGYAVKAGAGNSRNFFDLIYFHAVDKEQSLNAQERGRLLPAENDVMALASKLTLLKNLILEAEGALSIFTRNAEDSVDKPPEVPLAVNSSSQALTAIRASLAYKAKKWSVAAGYKRIEPEYRSLGTYYFQNDVEQFTLSPRVSLAKGKVNLQASAGAERNDLLGLRTSSTQRLIGNFRLGWQLSQRYGVDLQYSNYGMTEKKKRPGADTSNVAQVQSLISCTNRYLAFVHGKSHALLGNVLYQKLKFNEAPGLQETRYASFSISYALGLIESRLSMNTAAGYTSAQVADLHTGTLNLNLGVQKSMYDARLQTGISANYQPSYNSGNYTGSFLMANVTAAYTIGRKHTVSIDFSFQRQKDNSPYALLTDAKETRAIIAYQLIL